MKKTEVSVISNRPHTSNYLKSIGVPDIPALTSPFDPGYDPETLKSHLDQSSHLFSILKVSMACWMVAKESATRQKVSAARQHHVPTVTGGGPFEIAVAQGTLPAYLDLCGAIGFDRIECADGFTEMTLSPGRVIKMAWERGLEVQYELGKKHGGAFSEDVMDELIAQGMQWLGSGARQVVIEARESAQRVGLFDGEGKLNFTFADRFARAFGLDLVMFEAPTKQSQFALLNHFGRDVHLCNVRLEEVLRVEIYRRGIHSDAFANDKLRPPRQH